MSKILKNVIQIVDLFHIFRSVSLNEMRASYLRWLNDSENQHRSRD